MTLLGTLFLLFKKFPFEEDLVLYLNNLKFLHPRMFCIKFDENWLAGSEEDFLKCSVHF
jgi:hypothetical protein